MGILTNLLCFSLYLFYQESVVSAGKNDVNSYFTYDLIMPNVRPKQDDQYMYHHYELPKNETSFIVHFEPVINMSIAHHLAVVGCEDIGWSKDGKHMVCADGTGSRKTLYLWATNAPPLDLPKGVGFQVGNHTDIKYLILNIHYGNSSSFSGNVTDRSGVRLYFTKEPQTKFARVAKAIGCGSLKAKSIQIRDILCRVSKNITAYPFAFRTHTHDLGTSLSGYVVKQTANRQMEWQLIGEKNPQAPQYFYPVNESTGNMTIERGDILAIRCIYNNTRSESVEFGQTHHDEMCNYYIMYYVLDNKMPQLKPCKNNNNCFQRWETSGLTNIPLLI